MKQIPFLSHLDRFETAVKQVAEIRGSQASEVRAEIWKEYRISRGLLLERYRVNGEVAYHNGIEEGRKSALPANG